MPPAKIPDSFHHASSKLFCPIIAKATPVPNTPHISVAFRRMRSASASVLPRFKCRCTKSLSVTVAALFKLVSMLLMAAAKMAAINSPAAPGGSWVAMKCGSTLSAWSSGYCATNGSNNSGLAW